MGHIYNGILLSHKKEQNNAIFSNMYGHRNCHTVWSKSDREIQIYDIAYMWNLKEWYKWTYLQNRNRVTAVEKKLMASRYPVPSSRSQEEDTFKKPFNELGDWDWHIYTAMYKTDN